MNASALEERLARHHEHGRATYRLDEKLGTLHGIDWAQLVLLNALDTSGGQMPMAELADLLGMSGSRLLIQVLPMEKLGLVRRQSPGNARGGTSVVAIQPSAKRLLGEASETAADLCSSLRQIP